MLGLVVLLDTERADAGRISLPSRILRVEGGRVVRRGNLTTLTDGRTVPLRRLLDCNRRLPARAQGGELCVNTSDISVNWGRRASGSALRPMGRRPLGAGVVACVASVFLPARRPGRPVGYECLHGTEALGSFDHVGKLDRRPRARAGGASRMHLGGRPRTHARRRVFLFALERVGVVACVPASPSIGRLFAVLG